MAVKLPADLPKTAKDFWYFDTANRVIHHHTPTEGYAIPQSGLEWCPQFLEEAVNTPTPCCLMLHDHSRTGNGYFFAYHLGKDKQPLRYSLEAALRRANTLNRVTKTVDCPLAMTEIPIERLIPERLRDLKKLKKSELVEIVGDLIHDWQQLNQIHNSRAVERNWCGRYETYQGRYNRLFRIFKLVGRHQLYGGTRSTL